MVSWKTTPPEALLICWSSFSVNSIFCWKEMAPPALIWMASLKMRPVPVVVSEAREGPSLPPPPPMEYRKVRSPVPALMVRFERLLSNVLPR